MANGQGQAALQGAAQGASAGAAFGPWGAAIGGVVGGAAGYLSGGTKEPPAPVYAPPPQLPGGASGQYGGYYIDPVTKRVVFLDNQSNAGNLADSVRNRTLKDMVLGGGNTAQADLEDQIKAQQQLIERLKNPQAGANAKPSAADYLSPEWVNPDGTPKKPSSVDYQSEMANRSDLFKTFETQVKGKGYGGGSTEEQFKRWVQDAYTQNIQGKVAQMENDQKTWKGNSATTGEGLDAATRRLETLLGLKNQSAETQAGFADNPLMKYLNQRNQTGNPDYETKFADPWTGKMGDEAQRYLDASHQKADLSAFDNLKVGGGSDADPGMPQWDSTMSATYAGAAGGNTMTPMGDYHGKSGDFIRNLNRMAEKNGASNLRLADEQAARRGMIGGSSDIARFAAMQGVDDQVAANLAQGYGLDLNEQSNWFNQKFSIDQHNSDVAKQAAQARLDAMSGDFSKQMAAKQFYEQLRQQAFGNEATKFGLNQSEQQRNYANMMGTLGQRTALDQRSIDNRRAEEGLDRQNFGDRLGLLSYLDNQSNTQFQQGIQGAGVTNQQAGLGGQQGFRATGDLNAWNAQNAALQNQSNLAKWQQGINGQAGAANAMGQAAQGMGYAFGSQGGSNGGLFGSNTGSTGFAAGGNSMGNVGYDPGSAEWQGYGMD